jgi:hypothetical protein
VADAIIDLSEKFARCSGEQQEQLSRLFLNVLGTPVRRFIVPLPDGRTPYLERFILDEGEQHLPKADRSKTYLHIIYASDGDRDPHDHPFDFESTIVWGSYREWAYVRTCTRCGRATRQDTTKCFECGNVKLKAMADNSTMFDAGDLNDKKAHDLHKLDVIQGPVVTLVRRGPKKREWGFQTDDGWEHHESYIRRLFPGAQPTEVD